MNLRRVGILLLTFVPLLLHAGEGDEVVVVYNSRMPESKAVAEHYAAARQVPKDQVFGFPLTEDEVMSRHDFTEHLQKPLAAKLEKNGLWKFGKVKIPAADGRPARSEERVVAAKIRYAVLCYGVPLKIAPSPITNSLTGILTNKDFQRTEAAVDSELAWLPLCRNDVSLVGPQPNLFYGTTNEASLNCTNGILLVARLDGPTPQIAESLVDKAMEAESNGFWGRAYFDTRGLSKGDTYYLGDEWLLIGAKICRQRGFDVDVDTNSATLPAWYPMSHIAIYAGWYNSDACGPFAQPKVEFMPGAFAYHLYSLSADTLRSTTRNWCGPLLAKGATCTMGSVYEPYLQFTPNIACFLQDLCNGWSFGEAAWASQVAVSWQNTVIGDPLYRPFKKSPPALHAQLAREHNPLIEWSFNRLVNLDLVQGVSKKHLSDFLENIPATAHSAVLTEKLADLYEMQGKPSSAIKAWQRALKLNPSPEQRIRLHRILTDKLIAAGRDDAAVENLRQFITDSPEYPGLPRERKRLLQLEEKMATATK